jgi:hypothetical protein
MSKTQRITIGRRPAHLVALAGLLFSLACASAEPSGPAPVPGLGTFALQLVDDQAVPAPTFDDVVEGENGAPIRIRVDASEGTLLVEPDGRWQLRVALVTYENGVRIYRHTYADFGRWHDAPGSAVRTFESEYIEGVRFSGLAGPAGVVIEHNVVGEGGTSRFAFGGGR